MNDYTDYVAWTIVITVVSTLMAVTIWPKSKRLGNRFGKKS